MFPARNGVQELSFQYACYPSPPASSNCSPPHYAAATFAGIAEPQAATDPGCWTAYRYDDWTAVQPAAQPFAGPVYSSGGYGGELATSPDSGLAASDLSGTPSPGLQGGAVPQVRPAPARSPFEWMLKPSYQLQPNPGKTRTKDKYRVVYSDHQRLELEKEFHYSRYITIRRKAELAALLGLSERQVKIWFQNRRAKERKQAKKRDELLHREMKSEPQQLQPFPADAYS
ncbi:unnamed protein product [Ixodes persulcatus]